ncbi:unnamed protein product, partial [Ectocarpus fasciculatus]
FSTSDTNFARENTATCDVELCPGEAVVASTCGSFSGDTYFRLYRGDDEVYSNDDSCGLGSTISYAPFGIAECTLFSLRQGCYGSDSCSGTTQVEIHQRQPSSGLSNAPRTLLPTRTLLGKIPPLVTLSYAPTRRWLHRHAALSPVIPISDYTVEMMRCIATTIPVALGLRSHITRGILRSAPCSACARGALAPVVAAVRHKWMFTK